MELARERSLRIYDEARDFAAGRGLILADTKFEFGRAAGELLLIDEVLTPDSSRYWPADDWKPGVNPPSFDKQFLRDYLEQCAWDKTPPPPPLPDEIVSKTRARYLEAYRLLTGRTAAVAFAKPGGDRNPAPGAPALTHPACRATIWGFQPSR